MALSDIKKQSDALIKYDQVLRDKEILVRQMEVVLQTIDELNNDEEVSVLFSEDEQTALNTAKSDIEVLIQSIQTRVQNDTLTIRRQP